MADCPWFAVLSRAVAFLVQSFENMIIWTCRSALCLLFLIFGSILFESDDRTRNLCDRNFKWYMSNKIIYKKNTDSVFFGSNDKITTIAANKTVWREWERRSKMHILCEELTVRSSLGGSAAKSHSAQGRRHRVTDSWSLHSRSYTVPYLLYPYGTAANSIRYSRERGVLQF